MNDMKIKWEEYHDDLTNLDYELPVFSLIDYKTQDDFYLDSNFLIYNFIFSAIEFAILNNLEQVPVFILDDYVLIVKRNHFSEKLEECRLYFEKIEMYEKCAQILKLQEFLK